MDNLLIGLGLILFVVGIVMLIVSFVKKTKKKTALLLVLIGFVVWIIGGTFVETEPLAEPVEEDIETQQNTITESSDSNSESDISIDYQNTENAAELQSSENSLDNAELFSDNFDEFYDNVSSLTTANIDDYINNALNKKVVWTGKVIDVYDNYASVVKSFTYNLFDFKYSISSGLFSLLILNTKSDHDIFSKVLSSSIIASLQTSSTSCNAAANVLYRRVPLNMRNSIVLKFKRFTAAYLPKFFFALSYVSFALLSIP